MNPAFTLIGIVIVVCVALKLIQIYSDWEVGRETRKREKPFPYESTDVCGCCGSTDINHGGSWSRKHVIPVEHITKHAGTVLLNEWISTTATCEGEEHDKDKNERGCIRRNVGTRT